MNTATGELSPPPEIVKLTEKQVRNFWARVNKDGPFPDQSKPHYAGLDRCWIWMGATDRKGYGQVSFFGKMLKVHRVSWMISNGPIPSNILVIHKCDVTGCGNPSHLTVGSILENNRDMESKGRANQVSGELHYSRRNPEMLARGDRNGSRLHPEKRAWGARNGANTKPEMIRKGELNGQSKLKEKDILKIREIYAKGGISQRAVAAEFGVSSALVNAIVRRNSWRHVT